MMETFRNLGHNIFFKIFLGFLGLTFVMFGISGFVMGGNSSWVAKIGGKTIAYDKYLQTLQNNREVIYRSNPTKEAMAYLNSDQFKNDTLERLVTRGLIQSLQEDFKIYPDKNLILKEIAASPSMKGKDGKFDRNLYQNFLRGNGLTEKQHLSDLSDEIVGGLIVQAFAYSPNVSEKLAKDIYQHRFQTRNADVITVTTKNVNNLAAPNNFELSEFFEKNKESFSLPEMRQISFVSFDVNNLKQEIKVSDEEVLKEYQTNKSEYQNPESASFYHILFASEGEANSFLNKLKSSTEADKAESFAKLANEQGKDKTAINLGKVTKKQLPSEISSSAFAIDKGKFSDVLKSKLGYHIFYVTDKTPASDMPFEKVKAGIKTKLLAAKAENQVQDNLKKVEDEILASNSLEKVAANLKTTVNKNLPKISADGLDTKKAQASIPALDDFIKNAFLLEKGKVSKIFTSDSNKKYYVVLVEDIEAKRNRSLDEVKALVTEQWIAQEKDKKLYELANKISKKLSENGGNTAAVASEFGVKLEKNRSFPRFYMIDAGNGRKVPYANKVLNEIFAAKLNGATAPEATGNGEISIAVVRSINTPQINDQAVKMLVRDLRGNFKNDILVSFNDYVTAKFPVSVNRKLIQSQQGQQ